MDIAMEKAIKELNINLDPTVVEHLVSASAECTDKDEIMDLCKCFLDDAGFTNHKEFMKYFSDNTEDLDVKGLKLLDTSISGSNETLDSVQPLESVKEIVPNSFSKVKTITEDIKDVEIIQDNTITNESASLAKMKAVSKHQAPGQRIKEIRRLKAEDKVHVAMVEPMLIEATTKQSRFHVDTLETLSNVVDLNGIDISIGGKPLLVDAELRLFTGVKYGLVGRNGVGKSTLFKTLGHNLLIGFPKNIRVLYVEQLLDSDSISVLDTVMEADKIALRAIKEFEILGRACEKGFDKETAQRIREIELRRLEDELIENNQLAIKRSGARGNVARADLMISEVTVGEARARLNSPITNDEALSATKTAMKMMEELHHTIELFDADAAKSKAIKILLGLGFTEEMINGKPSTLSGGWRIRAALAQALFTEPDILLLDEVTIINSLQTI